MSLPPHSAASHCPSLFPSPKQQYFIHTQEYTHTLFFPSQMVTYFSTSCFFPLANYLGSTSLSIHVSLLQSFWWLPFRQDNSSPVCPVATVPHNLTPILLHSFMILAWPLWHLSLQTLAQVDKSSLLLRKGALSPSRSLMPAVPGLPGRGRNNSTPKTT